MPIPIKDRQPVDWKAQDTTMIGPVDLIKKDDKLQVIAKERRVKRFRTLPTKVMTLRRKFREKLDLSPLGGRKIFGGVYNILNEKRDYLDVIRLRYRGGTHLCDPRYRVLLPASCTMEGLAADVCDCGEKTNEITLPALGHNWGAWYDVISPSCNNEGLRMRDCVRCLFAEDEIINTDGHRWDTNFTIDKAPTCTIDGSQSRHCLDCPKDNFAVIDDTIIPRMGHELSEWSLIATHHWKRECNRCDYTEERHGESPDGFLQLTLNDNRIVIARSNGDLQACCTKSSSSSSITVNGVSIKKDQVVKVEFGRDWTVNMIPASFLHGFSELRELVYLPDGLVAIGNGFLAECNSLTKLTLMDHDVVLLLSDDETITATVSNCPLYQQGVTVSGLTPSKLQELKNKLPNTTTKPYRKIN